MLVGGRRVGVETAISGVAEGWRVAVGLGKRVGELVRVGVAGDVMEGMGVGDAVGLTLLTGVSSGLMRTGVLSELEPRVTVGDKLESRVGVTSGLA